MIDITATLLTVNDATESQDSTNNKDKIDVPIRYCQLKGCGREISRRKPSGQRYTIKAYVKKVYCNMICRDVALRKPDSVGKAKTDEKLDDDFSIRQYALKLTKGGRELVESLYRDFKDGDTLMHKAKARDALIGITFGKAAIAAPADDSEVIDLDRDRKLIESFIGKKADDHTL